jgi:hypothetical protein
MNIKCKVCGNEFEADKMTKCIVCGGMICNGCICDDNICEDCDDNDDRYSGEGFYDDDDGYDNDEY